MLPVTLFLQRLRSGAASVLFYAKTSQVRSLTFTLKQASFI